MTKGELERLRLIAHEFLEMTDSLEDKKLDFSNVTFDEDVMKYIFSDRFILEKQKIEREITKQTNILNECLDRLRQQYPDFYCIDYLTKIRDYNNYYLVHIYGAPFEKVDFIFDKEENLVLECFRSDGSIDVIDENNCFVVKKDRLENKVLAHHFRLFDQGFDLVKVLYGVHTNILPVFGKSADVEFGDLVSWSGYSNKENKDKYVLYNYKDAKVVVPEFTDASYNYGNFSWILRDDLIRIINRIEYEDKCVELEFLIDKNGKMVTEVWDFRRHVCYSVGDKNMDQEYILNSVFWEVYLDLILKRDGKFKGKNKKKM